MTKRPKNADLGVANSRAVRSERAIQRQRDSIDKIMEVVYFCKVYKLQDIADVLNAIGYPTRSDKGDPAVARKEWTAPLVHSILKKSAFNPRKFLENLTRPSPWVKPPRPPEVQARIEAMRAEQALVGAQTPENGEWLALTRYPAKRPDFVRLIETYDELPAGLEGQVSGVIRLGLYDILFCFRSFNLLTTGGREPPLYEDFNKRIPSTHLERWRYYRTNDERRALDEAIELKYFPETFGAFSKR